MIQTDITEKSRPSASSTPFASPITFPRPLPPRRRIHPNAKQQKSKQAKGKQCLSSASSEPSAPTSPISRPCTLPRSARAPISLYLKPDVPRVRAWLERNLRAAVDDGTGRCHVYKVVVNGGGGGKGGKGEGDGEIIAFASWEAPGHDLAGDP
ncbi:hypothetical protein MN608_11165 [Microdochium nivale]|nr:hypothetical protein MN608_11165 [Microdochium nivale]